MLKHLRKWISWHQIHTRQIFSKTLSTATKTTATLVEQEQLTLPEHMSSPPVFSGVRVTRSWVLCVCFVKLCRSLFLLLYFFFLPFCCLFFFDIRILITPLVSSNSSCYTILSVKKNTVVLESKYFSCDRSYTITITCQTYPVRKGYFQIFVYK